MSGSIVRWKSAHMALSVTMFVTQELRRMLRTSFLRVSTSWTFVWGMVRRFFAVARMV